MWPWEHLAVGYIAYSLLVRLAVRRPPRAGGALAVAVGSQLPDAVDKPLAWSLELLPSGASLAHSIFVAVPGSVLAIALAARYRRTPVGIAFAVGWLTHLVADVAYPAALGRSVRPGYVLWPLAPAPSSPLAGLIENVSLYGERYVAYLFSPEGAAYLLFELALLVGAVALWIADGAPGLPLPEGGRSDRTGDPDS